MNIKPFLWIAIGLLLTACSSLQIAPSPPPPQPIFVEITPSLESLLDDHLYRCDGEDPGISLILSVVPNTSLDFEVADIIIRIGEPDNGIPGFAAQLGWEEIVMIANPEINVSSLDTSRIIDAYTSSPTTFSTWMYPKGDELRLLFEEVFLNGKDISPYILIAPDPKGMIEAIRSNPDGIGFVPHSWVSDGVEVISIEPDQQESLHQPVLAMTDKEPDGRVKTFLACLQSTSNTR